MRFHMLQNVQMALDFLRYKKVSERVPALQCRRQSCQVHLSRCKQSYACTIISLCSYEVHKVKKYNVVHCKNILFVKFYQLNFLRFNIFFLEDIIFLVKKTVLFGTRM